MYRGYTILPLSKLFWIGQLRNKQVYLVKEAQFYKHSGSFNIEERFGTLIEKRGFSKYRDAVLTRAMDMDY